MCDENRDIPKNEPPWVHSIARGIEVTKGQRNERVNNAIPIKELAEKESRAHRKLRWNEVC